MFNLADHGILVSVNVTLAGLLGERKHEAATEMVESAYNAACGSAKSVTYLIDRKHPIVKAVVAKAQQVRCVAYKYSFAWAGELRFVPLKAREAFEREMAEKIAEFDGACDDYVVWYPSLVTEAKVRLAGLYDATQYPAASTVRKSLAAKYVPWPVSSADQFSNLAGEIVAEYRKKMEAETVELTNNAVNQLIDRVEKTVSAFVTKLAAYNDEGDKVRGIFRDSLISNVADIAVLVRQLNFTNDPSLDGLAVQIERLARYSGHTLRNRPQSRDAVRNEGEALLNQLAVFKKTESAVSDLLSQVADYQ